MTENTAFAMGWVSGLFMGLGLMKIAWEHDNRRRGIASPGHDDWRRRINHENRRGPVGPAPLKLRRSEPASPEQFICMDEGRVQRGNGNGSPATTKPDIIPCSTRRAYHYNPATIAECGGPCEQFGPSACDCGAITWTDRPQPPSTP